MLATLTTLKLIWSLAALAAVVGFGLGVGLWIACHCGFRPVVRVRLSAPPRLRGKTGLAAEAQRHGDGEDTAECREVLRSQEDLQP